MRTLVIQNGIPDTRDLPDLSLTTLQGLVDGYIEPALTVPSPFGNGSITAYVNEEGWVVGMEALVSIMYDFENCNPIAGPIVFTGLTEDGETRELTGEELVILSYAIRKAPPILPVVEGGKVKGFTDTPLVIALPALTKLAENLQKHAPHLN